MKKKRFPCLLCGAALAAFAPFASPQAKSHDALAIARPKAGHENHRILLMLPGGKPEFFHQTDPRRFPLEDGSVDLTLLYDQIESHDNPVALLREAQRVLATDGVLVIVTKRPRQARSQREAQRCYRPAELLAQVSAIDGWLHLSDPQQGNPTHPLILLAKRLGPPTEAKNTTEVTAEAA